VSELREAMQSALAFRGDRAQIERRRRVLLGDAPDSPLADELVAALASEPLGLSLAELASRVRRRKADVLHVLRLDARFEHVGRARGSRWRRTGPGNRWERVLAPAEGLPRPRTWGGT
jgi:outer membrane protein TolC